MWNGRQLTTYGKNDTVLTYTYDSNGLRTSKTVEKIGKTTISGIEVPYVTEKTVTKYYYVNGNLHYQHSVTTDNYDVQLSEEMLYFYYDSNGHLTGLEHNDTVYYPATNLKGDVVAIYNSLGECIVRYEYDAWGNVIAVADGNGVAITDQSHIAHINPIRYRSYYYDTETEFYYLQSRYYNPEVGRFLNADSQLNDDILGMNMYAYCSNNPVNNVDPTGHAWYHWLAGAAIVAACAVATVVTAGGALAGMAAVASVASGVAASTMASTVAAGAFIGSSLIFGVSVVGAAATSNSVKEFNEKGNGQVVADTGFGALSYAADAYAMYKIQNPTNSFVSTPQHTTGVGAPKNNINPGGSYTKVDNKGNLYSYTQFDTQGRQSMRMDFQGKPHNGVLPHTYIYLSRARWKS